MPDSNRFDKLENKLDKIDEKLDSMSIILSKNTDSLVEHIRRTDVLENYVKEEIVKKELEPVKKHVDRLTWSIKAIFWFCGVVGTILVTMKKLGLF